MIAFLPMEANRSLRMVFEASFDGRGAADQPNLSKRSPR